MFSSTNHDTVRFVFCLTVIFYHRTQDRLPWLARGVGELCGVFGKFKTWSKFHVRRFCIVFDVIIYSNEIFRQSFIYYVKYDFMVRKGECYSILQSVFWPSWNGIQEI